jgi:hypothetical protein
VLLLTAQRREEVSGIRRTEIIGKVWPIPAARAKKMDAPKMYGCLHACRFCCAAYPSKATLFSVGLALGHTADSASRSAD